MKQKAIKIGLIGLGTVGSGVWKILRTHRKLLKERVGVELQISKVVVRSKRKKRGVNVPADKLETQVAALIRDPEIQIIVELIGHVAQSRKIALQAIRAKKHFVTANKALLALHGKELFTEARRAKVDICFEAAVGGGIPILRALREGFVGNQIESMFGIVNGTCNFILTEMVQRNAPFQSVLKLAQELGYAEANPKFDVDGIDAAQKLAILISIAYGVHVDLKQIYVEGIRGITPLDLDFARRFGYELKLLAIAKHQRGSIQARVHPTMIPGTSMLAAVSGVHNAIFLDGDFVGEGMLYGKGAGSEPTASAVVGDIVEVARSILAGVGYTVPPIGTHAERIPKARIQPIGELSSPYYLRFQVIDQAGVLAKLADILSKSGISIASVYQEQREEGKEVPIVILAHEAKERDVVAAVKKINRLKFIKRPTTLIRIEENCR